MCLHIRTMILYTITYELQWAGSRFGSSSGARSSGAEPAKNRRPSYGNHRSKTEQRIGRCVLGSQDTRELSL
jgi:hypothetical protein